MMKKGQTWSSDAIIAVMIFIFIAISVLFIMGNFFESNKFERLSSDGEIISEGIASPKIPDLPGFVEGKNINNENLQIFANRSYTDLKSLFGVRSEFCIHFEDADGNLINISQNLTGAGSSKAKISGVKCGTLS